jgi:hypothetical protein
MRQRKPYLLSEDQPGRGHPRPERRGFTLYEATQLAVAIVLGLSLGAVITYLLKTGVVILPSFLQ